MTDDFSYLSEEIKREIEQFWGNIPQLNQGKEGQDSEYKTRFLAFWECLEPLYIAFNARLIQQGYTYEGHLYRLVAEEIASRTATRPPGFVTRRISARAATGSARC